jgi:hypothetical protein
MLTSQPVSVEQDNAPKVEDIRDNRTSSPRQDNVNEMLSITWMGWRNV